MLRHLKTQPVFALDTESDSLFRYYPKVCLIQISAYATPSNHISHAIHSNLEIVDYLVDTIRFPAIEKLNELLADPAMEIIIHAASNDILTLQRDWHFSFNHIFDTQLAARILGWKQTGLAAILKELFDVSSDKRMQRTNWRKRPLTGEQIVYAQMDTHYLLPLRNILHEELEEREHLEEATEAFDMLSRVDYRERPVADRTFWQMKGARDVPREQTAVLEAIWLWREQEAQRQDRPPFKIANDRTLVAIAQMQPSSREELRTIEGMSTLQVQRYGRSLLRAVREGRRRPSPKAPKYRPRPAELLDGEVLQRYEVLRRWRTDVAQRRGVDPDIIFSNDILLSVARKAPMSEEALQEIQEIGPWKARTYGASLFQILSESIENP
ncbi:HRDC domain-containing protein [Chloroflexi bacterium TSY]|nr:HRDC domain-containing protein [Chloroflexi bacterium TSY]